MKTLSMFTDDQRKAARWIHDHKAAILWADVGTGKTVSTLTALLRLLDRKECHKILVVGPRLVAERVWATEVTEWQHLSGLRVSRIIGSPDDRRAAIDRDADVYTISRDNVTWLEEQYIRVVDASTKPPKRAQYRKFPWDCIVLDESQSFKDQASKRFDSMRRLRRLVERIYLLSGSLMPNGYQDLWAQMYLVDFGARLGASENAYHKRYFTKSVNDGVVTWEPIPALKERIDMLVADVTMVMRDTQKPVDKNFITVCLDKAEQQTYSRMVRERIVEMSGAQINAVNAGVLWGKLLQMANGAVYDADRNVHVLHNKKIEALLELLESLPRPVIVGYGFVHDVDRIQAALFKAGVKRVGILRTSKSLDSWRRGDLDVGIMHPASAGHGLNDLYVSGAENLVWFGLTPNREFYDQLNGRLAGGHRRTGRKVCIHHIIADNTIDTDAAGLLDYKGEEQTTAQVRIIQTKLKEAA